MEIFISAEQIQERTRALGAQITRDYEGHELTVVCVLKGSFVFCADLVRQIDLPLTVDFLGLASYGSATESSGVVRLTTDLSRSIEGRDVLIVEDIIDTGLTMKFLLENFATRKPKSLAVCTFLEKPSRARQPITIAYKGFVIADEFVVGYGLDLDEKYRNLPYIGVWR